MVWTADECYILFAMKNNANAAGFLNFDHVTVNTHKVNNKVVKLACIAFAWMTSFC